MIEVAWNCDHCNTEKDGNFEGEIRTAAQVISWMYRRLHLCTDCAVQDYEKHA